MFAYSTKLNLKWHTPKLCVEIEVNALVKIIHEDSMVLCECDNLILIIQISIKRAIYVQHKICSIHENGVWINKQKCTNQILLKS